ncbi:hypothetical protein, partial [Burkholderia cenocepacia]
LIALAGEGRLTDIEEWLGQYVDEPDHAPFVHEMRAHLDALDLHAIEKLAGSLKRTRVADTSFDTETDATGPA